VALAGKSSDRVSIHRLDITDRKAVDLLPEEIIKIHGHVDGLINNAGIIQPFISFNDLGNDRIK
jgi:NAD(P)-dependent dehydrogenase (short-subunit alcohol dehydrogenase family)